MKKILYFVLSLALVLCCGLVLNSNQKVFAESSTETRINEIINEIYLSDLENVKDRTAGSVGEKNMASKLENFLQENDFAYFNDLTSYQQTFSLEDEKTTQNVIGVKANSTQNFVIIGAHYDCVYKENSSYGYSDNLSGVVAVMCLAEQLKNNTNFNLIVAFWGAEETGCNGSVYFAKNMPQEIKENTLLYINFDSVGVGDYCYYYTNDFVNNYQKEIDNALKNSSIKKYDNQLYGIKPVLNGFNYNNLPFQTDNSSFLQLGINCLSYFAGNVDDLNGLGFFETSGHQRIMHNTDTKETVENIFGEEHFAKNISIFVEETFNLLKTENFNQSEYVGNQVQAWAFSLWLLKFFGVCLIVAGFVSYLIVYFVRHKKDPKTKKQQGTYYNKMSKKKLNKLKKLENK